MKRTSIIIAIAAFLLMSTAAQGQILKPKITFKEDPLTHNVHIASNGKHYYTVNGGRKNMGQVNKLSLDGKLVDSYKISLDMRSIMYNEKDQSFYVCTYDKKIVKITDLDKGTYETILVDLYDNEQANLALSPSGKFLYYFSGGTLQIFKFPSGKLYKTYTGIDSGKESTTGASAIATDGKYLYTWNADYKIIFAYDLKGKKVKSFEISKGNYGFSLSCANGLVFVAVDGDYDTGTWYGYDLWAK